MLGIMAGMFQKDSSTLFVVFCSGMCHAGLAGYDAPRVMFPSIVCSLGNGEVAQSMLQSRHLHELDTAFMSPLHLVGICSPSGRFCRGVSFEPSGSGVAGTPGV